MSEFATSGVAPINARAGESSVGFSSADKASFRERARRTAATRPFAFFMALVVVFAGIYYWVIAAPLYVSETRFSIRSKQAEAPTGLLTGLFGTPSGLSDIISVSDYIESQDMMNELQRKLDLRRQYSQPRLDLFQELGKNASREQFAAFYKRHIVVKLDREASTVIVQAKAFEPKAAQTQAQLVLEQTEQFVNGMSQRLRNESVGGAQAEYDKALKAAEDARNAVSNFRGANADLDPSASGAFLVSSLGSLQAAAVTAQGQLAALRTYSRPDAPAVKQLEAQLANLNAQISATKARQGSQSNRPQQLTSFETIQLIRANAERTLASAQATVEAAKASAQQQEKFVVRIVQPNLPQRPTEPKRILEFITALIFGLAAYALGALSLAAIRDHRGI